MSCCQFQGDLSNFGTLSASGGQKEKVFLKGTSGRSHQNKWVGAGDRRANEGIMIEEAKVRRREK